MNRNDLESFWATLDPDINPFLHEVSVPVSMDIEIQRVNKRKDSPSENVEPSKYTKVANIS